MTPFDFRHGHPEKYIEISKHVTSDAKRQIGEIWICIVSGARPAVFLILLSYPSVGGSPE